MWNDWISRVPISHVENKDVLPPTLQPWTRPLSYSGWWTAIPRWKSTPLISQFGANCAMLFPQNNQRSVGLPLWIHLCHNQALPHRNGSSVRLTGGGGLGWAVGQWRTPLLRYGWCLGALSRWGDKADYFWIATDNHHRLESTKGGFFTAESEFTKICQTMFGMFEGHVPNLVTSRRKHQSRTHFAKAIRHLQQTNHHPTIHGIVTIQNSKVIRNSACSLAVGHHPHLDTEILRL